MSIVRRWLPLGERGAAAVEMAIVLPLLLLVMGGMVDFGRALFTQNVATNAAREGARMRALGYTTAQADVRISQSMVGSPTSSPTPHSVVYTLVQGGSPGTTLTNGNCPATPAITDRQRVVVTITNFNWIFPLPVTAPTLTAQAEIRCGG